MQNEKLTIKGHYRLEVTRKATGRVEVYETENLITDVGANFILDQLDGTNAVAQNLFCGLIVDPATIVAADTMAAHAGWTENQDYDEATRPQWDDAVAAALRSKTNATAMVFTMNATVTINGAFLCANSNTKGGTTGTLISAASFASTVGVVAGDIINVTYTMSVA